MSISVNCVACGKVYSLKPEAAGQSFVCQACGGQVEVPGGNPQPTEKPISDTSTSPGGAATQGGTQGRGGGRRVANAGQQAALARVKWPAILMMITAGIGCFLHPVLMIMQMFGIGYVITEDSQETIGLAAGGTAVLVWLGFSQIAAIMVLVGAWKMKNLRAYGFSVTAMVFGILPCMSICCTFSLFVGIWGLVVLNDANVKAAFRSARG
jgi:hypothetical protein